MEKTTLVEMYVKEKKGVDVKIKIQSQNDLILLEHAFNIAYKHFYGKDYTVIIPKPTNINFA